MSTEKAIKNPPWIMRRIAIFGWLILCCLSIIYILVEGDPSNSIHTTALNWAYGSAVATVFSYAGWATLEDISLAKLLR